MSAQNRIAIKAPYNKRAFDFFGLYSGTAIASGIYNTNISSTKVRNANPLPVMKGKRSSPDTYNTKNGMKAASSNILLRENVANDFIESSISDFAFCYTKKAGTSGFFYRATYGSSPMKRDLFTACESFLWFFEVTPVLRRESMRP
jgi:hypothetical protein